MQKQLDAFKCLDRLSEICLTIKSPYSNEDLRKLRDVCITLSKSGSHHRAVSFWFNLQDRLLPLECLWYLQAYNLVQFTTYFANNSNVISGLSESFEKFIWCQDETCRQDCSEIVAGLLVELVNVGPLMGQDICRPGQELLESIMQQFVDRLLQDPTSLDKPVPFLHRLLHESTVFQCQLKAFCLSLLRGILHYAPDTVALEDAVRDQAMYTCGKTSPIISQIFNEILAKLSIEDFIKEVNTVIMSQECFNWRWLLTAVSVFVASHTQGITLLKGEIERWLSQACTSKNTGLLSCALLCARQCCAENSQKFGLYGAWFGSLQVRPTSAFLFLYNFLSELVPYEPVLYLKIHVNKVPSVPANCHGVGADYAVLAKTRLADLNETTDYVGLFGEYTTTEQEGREADVTKVITHFKQSKEVMKIVLEASVFRRQFYEKVFLAELLKDDNPEHFEFIEKLYKIGKIPHGLYSTWHQRYLEKSSV